MTSVLAVRQKAWMVFFIGTGDGQLIKVCIKVICICDWRMINQKQWFNNAGDNCDFLFDSLHRVVLKVS